jgi:hypothetical protein
MSPSDHPLLSGALADRNLLAIEVEHEQADRRGQVAAAPPLRIDRGDELRLAAHSRALPEALPEFIFEAHAGAMAIDEDGRLTIIDLARRLFRRLIGITCRGGPWSPFLGAVRAWRARLQCEDRLPYWASYDHYICAKG